VCVYIPRGTKTIFLQPHEFCIVVFVTVTCIRYFTSAVSIRVFHEYQILFGCQKLQIWPRCKTFEFISMSFFFAPIRAYQRKTPAIPSLCRQLVVVTKRISTLQQNTAVKSLVLWLLQLQVHTAYHLVHTVILSSSVSINTACTVVAVMLSRDIKFDHS
jgi:hypothetical protein